MKIKITLLFTFLLTFLCMTSSFSQESTSSLSDTVVQQTVAPSTDSLPTSIVPTVVVSKLTANASVLSRRIENGVGFNSSAAVVGELNYNFCEWSTLSTKFVGIDSQNSEYGSSLENSLSVKNRSKHFTFTVSDLFYFVGEDRESNQYFSYGTTTRHLVNASLKYGNDEFFALVRGTVYTGDADDNNGVFVGAGVNLIPNLQLNLGYVTDASTTDFRTSDGLTHIGLVGTKDLHMGDFDSQLKLQLSFNPTDNVVEASGLSHRPVQFSVGLVF
jgi:hypothetical protein